MRSQGYITDYKKKPLTSGDGMEILNANSFPGFGIKKNVIPTALYLICGYAQRFKYSIYMHDKDPTLQLS